MGCLMKRDISASLFEYLPSKETALRHGIELEYRARTDARLPDRESDLFEIIEEGVKDAHSAYSGIATIARHLGCSIKALNEKIIIASDKSMGATVVEGLDGALVAELYGLMTGSAVKYFDAQEGRWTQNFQAAVNVVKAYALAIGYAKGEFDQGKEPRRKATTDIGLAVRHFTPPSVPVVPEQPDTWLQPDESPLNEAIKDSIDED